MLATGLAHSKKGEYKLAIAEYSKLILAQPKFADAYINRGNAHDSLGDEFSALRDYNRAVEYAEEGSPTSGNAFMNRGVLHTKIGKFKEAEIDFGKALACNPKDADVHFNRACLYERMGRTQEALSGFTQAIELNFADIPALCARGLLYFSLGDDENASRDLSTAMNHENVAGDAALLDSARCIVNGDFSDAEGRLNEVVQVPNQNSSDLVLAHLGLVILQVKRTLIELGKDSDADAQEKAKVFASKAYAFLSEMHQANTLFLQLEAALWLTRLPASILTTTPTTAARARSNTISFPAAPSTSAGGKKDEKTNGASKDVSLPTVANLIGECLAAKPKDINDYIRLAWAHVSDRNSGNSALMQAHTFLKQSLVQAYPFAINLSLREPFVELLLRKEMHTLDSKLHQADAVTGDNPVYKTQLVCVINRFADNPRTMSLFQNACVQAMIDTTAIGRIFARGLKGPVLQSAQSGVAECLKKLDEHLAKRGNKLMLSEDTIGALKTKADVIKNLVAYPHLQTALETLLPAQTASVPYMESAATNSSGAALVLHMNKFN